MTTPIPEPVDLDEARDALADNGIDGPDLPYNPRALAAMRVADTLIAEVERLTALTATCACPAGPAFEGPQADCPVHGALRALNDADAEPYTSAGDTRESDAYDTADPTKEHS